jgi:hypothetical protein
LHGDGMTKLFGRTKFGSLVQPSPEIEASFTADNVRPTAIGIAIGIESRLMILSAFASEHPFGAPASFGKGLAQRAVPGKWPA